MAYQPKHMRPQTESVEPAETQDHVQLENVSKNASLISVLVIISRISGLFRTWAQAYAVGATVLASVYSVANQLPNMLYELVVAGMLTTAFLPVYMSVKKKLGSREAQHYVGNLLGIVGLFMAAITVLSFIFATQIVLTQSYSANAEFDFDLTVYFFRFFCVEVLLYTLSTIFSGVLNAERDYLWSSAAPIFNNFVTTASFIVYAVLAPVNPQLAIIVLALGNPLGVLIQVVVQIPSLRKHGIHLTLHLNAKDPYFIETVKLGLPTLLIMATSFMQVTMDSNVLLSVDATGVSVMTYARLWYTLPYAVLAVPITTAFFTEFSDLWASQDIEEFNKLTQRGIQQVLFFMIPFGIYLIVFSVPLVSIISSGKFLPEDITKIALYTSGLALSLPFYGVGALLTKICSAMRKQKHVALAAVTATAVYIVLEVTLTPYFGITAVAVMLTVLDLIEIIFMGFILRKELTIDFGILAKRVIQFLVFGLLGGLAGYAILHVLPTYFGAYMGLPLKSALYTAAGGMLSLLVTYGLALVFKIPEAEILRAPLRRLKRVR